MSVRQKSNAFTLIELLVVIAIIAILAAILFPVFAQARAKARQTTSLSNTKQMDLGFQMYKQDYDEKFPYFNWGNSYFGSNTPSTGHWESFWMNAIYPYEKNVQLYKCPSDLSQNTPENTAMFWWVAANAPVTASDLINKYNFQPSLVAQEISYGTNEPLLNGGFGVPSDALVDRPAQTLIVADMITALTGGPSQGRPDRTNPNDARHKFIMRRVAYAQGCDGTWWGGDQSYHNPAWDAESCTRHSSGSNIGFADGHAKWLRAQNITDDLYMGDQAN